MVFIILTISIISAFCYRSGGLSKLTRHWIPQWLRHSWVRDYLCPVLCLLPIISDGFSWWIVLVYLLTVLCLSTYWDWLWKEDNFWFSGLMLGVAWFPLVNIGFPAYLLVIRAVIISVLWDIITRFSDNDFFEEYGRGLTLCASTIILYLPSLLV